MRRQPLDLYPQRQNTNSSKTATTRSFVVASHIFPARPAAECMTPKRNSNLHYSACGDFRLLGLRTIHSNWPKHVHRNRLRLSLQPQCHRTMRSRAMDADILQGSGDISTTSQLHLILILDDGISSPSILQIGPEKPGSIAQILI